MKRDRADFRVRDADDYDALGSIAITCNIEFDRERKCWRASDEHGNEAFSDYKPLAALKLFTERLTP